MKRLLLFLTITTIIVSCDLNETRIVYDENDKRDQNENPANSENNVKLIADLPFSFDSLDYLYFPIGETYESFRMDVRSFSSSYSNSSKSYSLGSMDGRYVNCNLSNIMIRPKNSSKFTLLTKLDLKIKSLNYLYSIDTLHGIDRFIYRVIDFDSNKDSFINDDDLIGLYSSKTNGENFKRISPGNQQLIDWETSDVLGLLYFRTMEDIDRNGEFDEKDRLNLYEYDLIKEDSVKLIFNDQIYQQMK